MAAKKKKLATPPVTPDAPVQQVEAPRVKFYFGPFAYYAQAVNCIALMSVEAITKGMKIPALKDFSARYKLKIDAFLEETGGTPVVICENGNVYVPPPAKKVRTRLVKKASAKK